jgi:hypothetical protein
MRGYSPPPGEEVQPFCGAVGSRRISCVPEQTLSVTVSVGLGSDVPGTPAVKTRERFQ